MHLVLQEAGQLPRRQWLSGQTHCPECRMLSAAASREGRGGARAAPLAWQGLWFTIHPTQLPVYSLHRGLLQLKPLLCTPCSRIAEAKRAREFSARTKCARAQQARGRPGRGPG